MDNNLQCLCGARPSFFHSLCCNAHFEGIIKSDGKKIIACEECGKFVGELKD